MVHFEPADEATTPSTDAVAPVTYLPGAGPGMKRRSPLEPRDPVGAPQTESAAVPPAPVRIGRARDKPAENTEPIESPDVGDHEVGVDEVGDDEGVVEPDGADLRERAESVLLQRLRARSLSLVEAFVVLTDLDLDAGEAHDVVERFVELAYLDDVKLADQIIHTHHERKGLGRAGVETEMRRRKLDPGVMLDKLDELPDDEQERANAEAIKRIQQLSRFDDQTIDRRLNAFLMRKGYNFQVVRDAVKAALASRGGGSSGVRFR